MAVILWYGAWTILVLTILSRLSARVRYNLRFIVFMVYTFLSTLVFVPFMLHRPRDSRNGLLPAWAVRWCSRLFLGLTFEVRGEENILPPVMTYIWPKNLAYMNGHTVTKREVFWVYPFPWLWNTVFIDKLNPERAQNDINTVGKLIKTNNARLCMFPEGTRHMGPELLPFKKGAFHIALSAQCPIQPVVCSKYYFLDGKQHRFESGHSVIEYLPPIPTEGLTKKDLPDLMDKVRDAMQQAFTRLSQDNTPAQSIKPATPAV